MSITLESLQEMWVKDAEIDRDNLHDESLNIPSLHAKYFELYNTVFLLRKKAEQQSIKNIRRTAKKGTSVMNGMNILVARLTLAYT